MKKKIFFLVCTVGLLLSGCEQAPEIPKQMKTLSEQTVLLSLINQQQLDNIAEHLTVKYHLITNVPSEKCDSTKADGKCFTVELSFTANEAITAKGWEIYFSQISPVQSSQSSDFNIVHTNGDLHRISLKESFSGFIAGETKKLLFRSDFWMVSETDALPNYIISANQLKPRVITSTVPKVDAETALEYLPFVVAFTNEAQQFKKNEIDSTKWLTSKILYQRNADAKQRTSIEINELHKNYAQKIDHYYSQVHHAIIPTPKFIDIDKLNKQVDITQGVNIDFGNVNPSEVDAAIARLDRLGLKTDNNGLPLMLTIEADKNKAIGSYNLDITPFAIKVIGVDANGVFNALQSLASLMSINVKSLPVLTVKDEPHYGFRGMLIDVARNFHSKAFILKLLEQMSAYKLNKLHLHLGDDEGWRLEIPSLPELTEVGSKRCFDSQEQECLIPQLGAGLNENSNVNGFYTVSDYQEILKAASARHIQVIPSLDMPGHSRAAIKAMTARFNKYKVLEDIEKATQFQLHDFSDATEYLSVQFYNDNTINVCLESSYAFVSEVMQQVKKIHLEAGQPLTRYHIGADETAGAWIESPACKAFVANNTQGITHMNQLGAYFIERVAKILSNLGIETAGWSDGLAHTRKENMPAIVQANAWDVLSWNGHSKVHELVNRNWEVVISSPDVMYFDFPYEADPKEYGYYWASRHINTEKIFQFMPDNLPIHAEFWLDRDDNPYRTDDTLQKSSSGEIISAPLTVGKRFYGLQGQLWSENTRTDEMVEYKVFPRLIALAERAWYLPNWAVPYNYQGAKYSQESHVFTKELRLARDKQWQHFSQILAQKEFAKLELDNIHYRLPTVGAYIDKGLLFANVSFEGLPIEFQVDDGKWQLYQLPVVVQGKVKVRSRSLNGKRSGRITNVTQ